MGEQQRWEWRREAYTRACRLSVAIDKYSHPSKKLEDNEKRNILSFGTPDKSGDPLLAEILFYGKAGGFKGESMKKAQQLFRALSTNPEFNDDWYGWAQAIQKEMDTEIAKEIKP